MPMNLSIVETKLNNNEYETGYQFALDMRSIWSNSFYYNSNNANLYSSTMELSILFEKLMKGNEHLVLGGKNGIINDIPKKIDSGNKNIAKDIQSKPKSNPINQQVVDKPMGYAEKKQLCENIKKIEPKYLKGVLDIVKGCTDIKGEELEFDIDKLPPRICHELDKYTKNCLKNSFKALPPKKNRNSEDNYYPHEKNGGTVKPTEAQNEVVNSNDIYIPADSEPSSESSSTSESEEEVPSPEMHNPQSYQRINEDSKEFTGGYGSIDMNKFY